MPIQPISSLSPFIGTRWSIKARVIDKSTIRTWNNARGSGQLFSMTLIDDQKDAIRATMFQEGVDKYYEKIQNEQVYIFSKGSVKNANKKFSTLTNDYELSLDGNSEIAPVADDNTIVRQKFTIVSIANLSNKEKNSSVDLCAVVSDIGEVSTIVTKAGESLKKRVLTLIDQSDAQVELTVWQDKAENLEATVGDLVAVKSARIGDWSGISLSLSSQGCVIVNPDIEQVQAVKQWLATKNGDLTASTTLTTKGGGGGGAFDERKTFSAIQEEGLGTRDDGKPDYLSVRATLTYIKQENMSYPACPVCNKKVMPVADGGDTYRCDKCEKNVEANHRYILQLTANDHTGSQWITAFQDVAEPFLGMDAKSLQQAQEQDSNFVANLCKQLCFSPYLMRIRAKEEMVLDEKRMKCGAMRLEKMNFKKESSLLLQEIGRYMTMSQGISA